MVRYMENLQLYRAVLEISCRVPVQVVVITDPLHSVLQFPVSQMGGKDLLHFPFILVIDSDWWWCIYVLAGKGLRCGGPVEVLWVDNWVDLDRGRQVYAECISFLCKDLERACPLIV